MRFYFHMSGDGIGTLSVFRKSEGHLHLLLNLTGDQGNYWQMREVPLSHTRDFQVTFEGKVGRSSKGDICLDDITFSSGCLLVSPAGVEDNTPPPLEGIHSAVSLVLYMLSSPTKIPTLTRPPLDWKQWEELLISSVLLSGRTSITLYLNLIYYNPTISLSCLSNCFFHWRGTQCHCVSQSVHHFGFVDWNISTAIKGFVMKSSTDTRGPQRMNLKTFGDPRIFPLTPPWG